MTPQFSNPRPRRSPPPQKLGFPLSKAEIEALVACEAGAAPPLIAKMFSFLTEGTLPAPAPAARSPSPPRQLHHPTVRGRPGAPSSPGTLREGGRAAYTVDAGGCARPYGQYPYRGAEEEEEKEEEGDDFAYTASDGEQPLPEATRHARISSKGAAAAAAALSLESQFASLAADVAASFTAAAASGNDGDQGAKGQPGRAAAAPRDTSPTRRRVLSADALLAADAAGDASLVSWGLPSLPSVGDQYGAVVGDHGGAAFYGQPPGGGGGGGGQLPAWREADDEDDPFARADERSRQAGQPGVLGGRGRTEYVPYTQADYARIVGARAYWQLGRLGPDLDREELVSKRAARERALEFARQAHSQNSVELAGRPRAVPRPPPQTARERMRAWAEGTLAPGGGLVAELGPERLARTAERRLARSLSPARKGPRTAPCGGGSAAAAEDSSFLASTLPLFKPGSTLVATPLGRARREVKATL